MRGRTMLHEVDERDPGAVVEGEAGGISGALRWIGQAVVFVRIESDGGMRTPAVYSARVLAAEEAREVGPFTVEDRRTHGNHGIDSPETFDAVALAAARMAQMDEIKARGGSHVGAVEHAISRKNCRDGSGRIFVRRAPEGSPEAVESALVMASRS